MVVLVLRLGDGANGGEGLRLGRRSMEEILIDASVGDKVLRNRASACGLAAKSNVTWITAKLYATVCEDLSKGW